jgi:hypothetical protein
MGAGTAPIVNYVCIIELQIAQWKSIRRHVQIAIAMTYLKIQKLEQLSVSIAVVIMGEFLQTTKVILAQMHLGLKRELLVAV